MATWEHGKWHAVMQCTLLPRQHEAHEPVSAYLLSPSDHVSILAGDVFVEAEPQGGGRPHAVPRKALLGEGNVDGGGVKHRH